MTIPAGTTLGRYEICSPLGAGGMGEVYLAHDSTLHRPVAVKVLRAAFTANEVRLHRFEREAIAASSLNHPNILTIYEIGHEDGYHFIVTEFIDGESLGQRLARGSCNMLEVLETGIQLTSALSAAHAAGIVHRDIRPDNIMLRRDALVKVLDFGLAKLDEQKIPRIETEVLTRALPLTLPGVVMGTACYMSPEQARGLSIDSRTDIWSLGVVLYQMITGHLPFSGKTMSDLMAAVLKAEPPALTAYAPGAPSEMERIVRKALQKDAEKRYQSSRDLELDLEALKQRSQFEAQLARSSGASRGTEVKLTAASPTTAASEVTRVIVPPNSMSAQRVQAESSAESLVSRITRHKLGVLLVLAILALTIVGGYFAYSYYSSQ